jgi:type I restriction enzyme R subunit
MSYEYSENILVQESAGHLLHDELGWDVEFAYNTEKLGADGTFGRKTYREIILYRYFKEAVMRLNPWLTEALYQDAVKTLEYHLASSSLMQINEKNYSLLRDGIRLSESGEQSFPCSQRTENPR